MGSIKIFAHYLMMLEDFIETSLFERSELDGEKKILRHSYTTPVMRLVYSGNRLDHAV